MRWKCVGGESPKLQHPPNFGLFQNIVQFDFYRFNDYRRLYRYCGHVPGTIAAYTYSNPAFSKDSLMVRSPRVDQRPHFIKNHRTRGDTDPFHPQPLPIAETTF